LTDLILVTGGTGYIGSCLVPCLLEKGYRVRLLVRDPGRLRGRAWLPNVEVVPGDLMDPASLKLCVKDVRAAVYLVHNMTSGREYETRELESARNFLAAAEAAKIQHIVYLGGLANLKGEIGPHLRSRIQTGEVLRSGRIPVTEFRASLIIGSGSISFEMIRYLTEQFPLILGRRNLKQLTQPIAIKNVLEYILGALETPASRGHLYEIGGGSVLSYAETMLTYARLRELSRHVLLFPWIPETLIAYITGRITPVPARITRPLVGGMRGDSIVLDGSAREMFPSIDLLSYEDSVILALEDLSPSRLDPNWLEAGSVWRGRRQGFFIESRQVMVKATPEGLYRVISRLGGKNGWIYLDGLWKFRGIIDRLLGGPGLRGRSSPGNFSLGDVLDFYMVEALIPGRLLRLRAELKAPGLGWMEWRMEPMGTGDTRLTQTAFFAPRGLPGFIYWYSLWLVHTLVFSGLIRGIDRQAVKETISGGDTHDNQL
jgi:uncharacterized protein YbjT (DUF2867 family)